MAEQNQVKELFHKLPRYLVKRCDFRPPPKLTPPEARGGLWNFGGFQAPILTLGHDCRILVMTRVSLWTKHFIRPFVRVIYHPITITGGEPGPNLLAPQASTSFPLFNRVLLGPVSRARNDSIAQVVVMRNSVSGASDEVKRKFESNLEYLELNLFKVCFLLLFTVVNHHYSTIWENIFGFFQASSVNLSHGRGGKNQLLFFSLSMMSDPKHFL